MTAPAQLAERLRIAGDQLGGQWLARTRQRLAQQWRERGFEVQEQRSGLIIAGHDLIRRRQGSRDALPDPQLLWPGDDG
jgi:hypothetical protein